MQSLQKHFTYLKAIFYEATNIRSRSLYLHQCLDEDAEPAFVNEDICFDFGDEYKFFNPYLVTYGGEPILITYTEKSHKPQDYFASDVINYKRTKLPENIYTSNRVNDVAETIGISFQEYVLSKHDWDIKKFFETAANIDLRLFTGNKWNFKGHSKKELDPKIVTKLVNEGLNNILIVEKELGI